MMKYVIEKLLEQKEQVKQQVRNTMLQKEKAITRQLEEVIHTQEDALSVKRIRDAIQENSDQEMLSANNQLIYSLLRLTEKCEKIGHEPIESANVKVTPVKNPLPQVVKHYTTIDSLFFKVKYFNRFVQRGQMAMLELITSDWNGNYHPRGGCEVTVHLESSVGEMISAEVTDSNDGTYMICFAAQKVGEISLSVYVNGREIEESPFRIMVREAPIKPSKIISDDDSFGQLQGIACGNNGMWAVADWSKNCVHIFDNQDKLVKRVGSQGDGSGQFVCPFDVAFDENNELYVTDSCNHRVQKFDPHGNYLLQFGGKGVGEGQLNHPTRITTHEDKVYVADRQNNRISVFKNDGRFYAIIGQQQLSRYFDITVNINSEILAADWGQHYIYIFTPDGFYANKMSIRKGIGGLALQFPCCITTDSNGFILIADTSTYNHCVSIFDMIGNCICCFGSKGSNDNQFKSPRGIAIAPNGNIHVSDTGNNRVLIFPSYSYVAYS